jgi:hypothetical protein
MGNFVPFNPLEINDFHIVIRNQLKIKKKIFNIGTQSWVEVEFIQTRKTAACEEFLKKYYSKDNGYLKGWWLTGTKANMTEKIYIHWKLVE